MKIHKTFFNFQIQKQVTKTTIKCTFLLLLFYKGIMGKRMKHYLT